MWGVAYANYRERLIKALVKCGLRVSIMYRSLTCCVDDAACRYVTRLVGIYDICFGQYSHV